MSWPGLLFVDLAAVVLLVWVLNMVRLGRLYVGYGVLLVIVLASIILTTSLSPLSAAAAQALRVFFPSAAVGIIVVGLGCLLIALVYVLSQITLLANRVATLVQKLAIERAQREEERLQLDRTDITKHEPEV